MAMITVRNIPDEVHRSLRMLAVQHGRSTEAEVREILAAAVRPASRVRLGDALAALGREAGLGDTDVDTMLEHIDTSPATPMRFE